MNKTEIEMRFNTLLDIYPDKDSKSWLTTFKLGVLNHITKLEEENKIQQEIMDQQAKLILEKG